MAEDDEMQTVQEQGAAGIDHAGEPVPAAGWRAWIVSILAAILLSVAATWLLGGK